MIIEDNILAFANAFFRKRGKWEYVTEEQKNKYFFIFNRYLSKKYTTKALLLNNKYIDKSTCMDLWYNFTADKDCQSWFWSKSEKKINESFNEKDFKLLLEKLVLDKNEDLEYLINKYPDLIKEELKFYKNKK
jgi:hypothetical protein